MKVSRASYCNAMIVQPEGEPKVRVGGGHAKGAGFERSLCVRFSLWITDGKRRDLFWRSSLSGGRATIGKRKGHDLSRQCGDMCSVAPEGHVLTDIFFFEFKHVRNIKLAAFITANRGPIAGWWKQACKQAKEHKREPILICKANHSPIIVITRLGSMFNQKPVANLTMLGCALGLLDRILKEPFTGLKPAKKRTVLVFPGDDDLELK